MMSTCLIVACTCEDRVWVRLDIATSFSCSWYCREFQLPQMARLINEQQTSKMKISACQIFNLT